MIEFALTSIGAGLLLAKNKAKKGNSDSSNKEVYEGSRAGEMYFGREIDNGNYDPFYDYGNDPVYNDPYALKGLEMAQETLSRAYRARIVAPFFSKKDFTMDAMYTYLGFPVQKMDIDNWEYPIPALPFVRGSFSRIEFVVEVFNPFEFDVPLQKMRIGNMSLGGKRIYPLPDLSTFSTHLNAQDGEGIWYKNLACSHAGLAQYWSNYLLRVESTMKSAFRMEDNNIDNRFKRSHAANFAPTDFEIDLVADSEKFYDTMRDLDYYYQASAISYENLYKKTICWPTFKQVIAGGVNSGEYDKFGKKISQNEAKAINAQVALQQSLVMSTLKTSLLKDMCSLVGAKYNGGTFLGKPLIPSSVSGGIYTITSQAAKKMTIPARSSVLLRIAMPVAMVNNPVHYAGFDYIRNDKGKGSGRERSNMRTIYPWFDYDDEMKSIKSLTVIPMMQTDGQINRYYYNYSGLTHNEMEDLKKLYGLQISDERAGGFLFYDFERIGDIKEQDFRMTCSFYADSNQSVIQNHKSNNKARMDNTTAFDLGCYRGGRPSGGAYEWEKTYWENYKYYDSIFDASEDLYGDGNLKTDFRWDFSNL